MYLSILKDKCYFIIPEQDEILNFKFIPFFITTISKLDFDLHESIIYHLHAHNLLFLDKKIIIHIYVYINYYFFKKLCVRAFSIVYL